MRIVLPLAGFAVVALAALTLRPDLVPGSRVGVETHAAGGGVAAATVAEKDATAPGPVETVVSLTTYPVDGSDETAILHAMARAAPRVDGEVFFGLTVTELSLRYSHHATAASCALSGVRVGLAVQTTLPAWTPGPDAGPDLRRDWARFAANLRRHEDGHRRLAEAGAERVRDALGRLAAPTCAAVDTAARHRAEQVRIETDAEHRRYDDETGHGRTQGAVWPLP